MSIEETRRELIERYEKLARESFEKNVEEMGEWIVDAYGRLFPPRRRECSEIDYWLVKELGNLVKERYLGEQWCHFLIEHPKMMELLKKYGFAEYSWGASVVSVDYPERHQGEPEVVSIHYPVLTSKEEIDRIRKRFTEANCKIHEVHQHGGVSHIHIDCSPKKVRELSKTLSRLILVKGED